MKNKYYIIGLIFLITLCIPQKASAAENEIDGWDVLYTIGNDSWYVTKELGKKEFFGNSLESYLVYNTADSLGYIDGPEEDISKFGDAMMNTLVYDEIVDAVAPDTPFSDVEDFGDVLFSATKTFKSDYSDVDGNLLRYVNVMDTLSKSTDYFTEGSEFSFAAKCAKTAADLGNFIMNSSEYKAMKAQYKTKAEFDRAFWRMSLEGVWDCLKDIPRELKQLYGDIAKADQLGMFDTYDKWGIYRNSHVITSNFLGFDPGTPQRMYGVEGDYNLTVTWGYDINDFDVQFNME